MESNIEILNELKELSPLIARMEKINVFTVPAGYFENLGNDILEGIESEKGLVVNGFPASLPSDVPQGYFDSLAESILGKISAQSAGNASDELKALSPMLYSIQNENVFEVPQGYFEGLAGTIAGLVNPQQAKVVSMQRRSSIFVKYAVAAAFTGAIALGVFQFTTVSKENSDPVIAQGMQIARENKFEDELAKITEADIIKFLEANGSDVKAALVAQSIDENELPSQEDYLSDDKALDKYLKLINVNDVNN